MRPIVRCLLAISLLFVPAGLSGQQSHAGPDVEVVANGQKMDASVVDLGPGPVPPPSAVIPEWSTGFHRCPSLASARRVLAALKSTRPATSTEAEPIFRRRMAEEGCSLQGDDWDAYDWGDEPMGAEGVEFDDGYGVDLTETRDRQGRAAVLLYPRGAC